jgi:pyruvate dehydrogenase E1 component beta subunit
MRGIDAIRDGLRAEMDRDERVIVLGEDVSVGGPFLATKGLLEAFGPKRVRDTPISEAAVAGMAVGAALSGLRPVLEVMFIDFITLAMDQLVNHAAKLQYISNGLLEVPLVVRAQGGVSGGMGAHHSQSLEAWFAHVPGLQVVAPATPHDAWGLLAAAIRSDDPVVVVEHRALYWQSGPVAEDPFVPIGSANVVQRGSHVTIAAWSRMTGVALAAAEQLASAGIDAEVVDVRSLQPLDLDTISASAAKTGHLIIVQEAVRFGGVGAEIAAQVGESVRLRSPVVRVAAPFTPVPFSRELEKVYLPNAEQVVAAVTKLLGATPVGR